jgi:hypothetical protein
MIVVFVFDSVFDNFKIAAFVLFAPFSAALGELFCRIKEAAFGALVFRLFLC